MILRIFAAKIAIDQMANSLFDNDFSIAIFVIFYRCSENFLLRCILGFWQNASGR